MKLKSKYKNIKIANGFISGIIVGVIIFGGIGAVAVTISAEQVKYTPSNSSFKVANTKEAVDELYRLSQLGNATASDLLSGKEALVGGQKIIGSMPNRGVLNWNPSSSTTYTIEPGYYSGGTLSSANSYNAGYSQGATTGMSGTVVGVYQYAFNNNTTDNHPQQSYTCPEDGIFSFYYVVIDEGNSGNAALYVNGVAQSPIVNSYWLTPDGSNMYSVTGNYLVKVKKGDVVVFHAHTNSTSGKRSVMVRADFIY